jgi:hypothetical protein
LPSRKTSLSPKSQKAAGTPASTISAKLNLRGLDSVSARILRMSGPSATWAHLVDPGVAGGVSCRVAGFSPRESRCIGWPPDGLKTTGGLGYHATRGRPRLDASRAVACVSLAVVSPSARRGES